MPGLNDLQNHFQELIRKGLEGSFFVKRSEADDEPIDALKGPSGLLELPPGYFDVGILTKDQGLNWTREVSTSDTAGLGYGEPVRRDITTDISGLQFTALESKRQIFEMYEGLDLSAVRQDQYGNVSWDKPDRPANPYYRGLALFKDGDGADALYFGKWGPRFQITERGEQAWREEVELQYSMTANFYVDSNFGTSLRSLWAGPPAVLTKMGFPAAA